MMKGWSPGFNIKAVLLLLTTGSVSSGKLLTFDIIGSKVHKIVGVTTGHPELLR